MRLSDYQRLAGNTAIYPGRLSPTDKGLHYVALGLCGEAGEVAGLVKKLMRDGTDRDVFRANLLAELGDVLWYISQIATEESFTLEQIAQHNLEKLASRQQRGVLGGSGDNR